MTKKAASTKTETGLTFSIKHDSEDRVLRGRAWDFTSSGARAAINSWSDPGNSGVGLGFRLVWGS